MIDLVRRAWQDWKHCTNKRREIATVIGLLLTATAFYLWRMLANEHAFACDNIVMGADGHEIIDGLSTEILGYDAFKRPLFSLLAGVPALVFGKLPGIDAQTAALVSLASWAGIAVTLLYVLIRRHFAAHVQAILIAACFAMSFSPATIFSIPETYGVTTAAFVFVLLAILEADRANTGARWHVAAFIGFVAGLSAFVYPPLLATLAVWLVLTFRRHGARVTIVPAFIAGATGIAIYYAGLLAVFGSEAFTEQGHYVDRFGSLSGLLQWETYASVFSVFYAMALVSPLDGVLPVYGLEQWNGYLQRPLAMIALALLAATYVGIAGAAAKRARSEPAFSAFAILLLVLTLFYTFFNARESMLYSVLGVVLIWVLAGWAWGRSDRPRLLLAACALAFAVANLAPLRLTQPCAPESGARSSDAPASLATLTTSSLKRS